MKAKILTLCAGIFLVSCVTTEHKVNEVDTKLDEKGRTDSGKIGINDKGQAIIQTENTGAEELKMQQLVNEELETKLNNEYAELKRCRRDLTDPRLGGSGELKEMSGLEDIKQPNEIKEEFGLDDKGELKVVKKEFFDERLKKEKGYEKSLRKMLKLVSNQMERCEMQMSAARNKVGLPGKRKEAKGHFTKDGDWVETEKGENSLDDVPADKANANNPEGSSTK